MTASRCWLKTAANGSLVGLFLAATALPLTARYCGWAGPAQVQEKRRLAHRPHLSGNPAELTAFPHQFDAYYSDNFGLRGQLIRLNSIARLEGLGMSPVPNVLVGRDGWLYYQGEGTIDDYRGLWSGSSADLQAWKEALEERQRWLAARGIAYLFVVAPNKHTIYPEYLPHSLKRVRPQTWADVLLTYLQTCSTVPVLDLRTPLLQAKSRERLYDRTDSHWNQRGAFVAYQAIMQSLSRWFPGVEPQPRSAFAAGAVQGAAGDLSVLLGLPDRLKEERLTLEPYSPYRARPTQAGIVLRTDIPAEKQPFVMECPGSAGPRAVMFHDSFRRHLVPFLSEHFQRITYQWQYEFDPVLIEREHPQVVIQEMVERILVATFLARNPPGVSVTTAQVATVP